MMKKFPHKKITGLHPATKPAFLFIIIIQILLSTSMAWAAHTYVVVPVSGLMARAQLSVVLPDCGTYQWNWGDGTTSGVFTILSSGTTNYFHTYPSADTYNVTLLCGGAPDPSYSVTVPSDSTAPSATITTPTTSPSYATSTSSVTLSGTASDNVAVSLVTWTNNRGGSGNAAGTSAWTATGITLQAGTNIITVTAHDAAGNTGTDQITITYTPPSSGGTLTILTSPSSSTVVPAQNNLISLVYSASASGGRTFTASSTEGRFVTQSGRILATVSTVKTISIINGSGTANETVTLPAGAVTSALNSGQNLIYYERTFTNGSDTATSKTTLQIVPASAGPFSLVRMDLGFQNSQGRGNNAGRITVPLNARNIRAVAHITYNGSGLLRAQWKVDDQVIGYVSQYLYPGARQAVVKSPEVPGFPSYDTGRHKVELEIISPAPPFEEPVIYYYVAQNETASFRTIRLLSPADGATTVLSAEPGNETIFRWKPLTGHLTYIFEILPTGYSATVHPVIRARTASGSYALSAMAVRNLKKGIPYIWHVKGIDNLTGQIVGKSDDRTVYPASAGSGSGKIRFLYLFFSKPGQELLIQAGIKNETIKRKTNIRIEFLVDGEPVDAVFIVCLAPGETRKVQGLYQVTDDKNHIVEVRALEGQGNSASVIAQISGKITGTHQKTTVMRGGKAQTSHPIILAPALVMTGLTPVHRVIHTPELEMTGLTRERRIIHTSTFEMTGLTPEHRIIHTPMLEMTGLTPERRIIHTSTLEMTGLVSHLNEMQQAEPYQMGNRENQGLNLTPAGTSQTTDTPLSSLSVVQPNGGEQWRGGRSYAVLWRNTDFHGNIRICLLGLTTQYNRILYRSINADLGRAMVHIPADVPTGNYKMKIESLDHAVHDESNNTFTIRGIGGFTAPDLQISDIQHLVNPERITAQVRNNGTPWHGPIMFRTVYLDPDGPYSETRNTSVDLILGAGESKWVDIINPFRWQNALDMPRLVFLVQIDPDGEIAEFDEENNQLQKEIALPCGLHINGLSHSWVYKGLEAQLFLYGTFGSERKSKTVGVLDEETHLYKVFPREWQPESLEVDLQNFPTGRYRFVVYCSDPDSGSAYSSNISSWVEIRAPENHSGSGPFPHESPIDAGKIVGALSDEFVPAETNFQVRIQQIWIEYVEDGWKAYASIHGALSVSLEQVVFEIWKGAERIRYGEPNSFHITSSGNYEESFVFQGLHDGAYTLKCRILDSRGNRDEASSGFILSGTNVQANN